MRRAGRPQPGRRARRRRPDRSPRAAWPCQVCGGTSTASGSRPARAVRFHVSAPAAYELTIVRLGRTALLDAPTDDDADRADAERLATFRHEVGHARRRSRPGPTSGSMGRRSRPGRSRIGTWLRLWRLPEIDVVQWAWYGLVGDLDFPAASRFALLVDHAGRVCVHAGDGGVFRHDQLHVSEAVLTGRLGEWVHLAASIEPGSPGRVTAYLDGAPIITVEGEVPVSDPGHAARLRVGATAEGGAAADFLDGDIAQPFVAASALGHDATSRRVVADRGRSPIGDLGLGPLHAAWDLVEERGARVADSSGNGRDGRRSSRAPPGRSAARPSTPRRASPATTRSPTRPRPRAAALERRRRGLRVVGHRRVGRAVRRSLGPLRRAGPPRRPGGGRRPWRSRSRSCAGPRGAPAASPSCWRRTRGSPTGDDRPTSSPSPASRLRTTRTMSAAGPSSTCRRWRRSRAPIPTASSRSGRPFTRHSHLVRPERYAEAWLEREGYAYEVITDHDLHEEPGLLSRFSALVIAGHSEYWTDEARQGVLDYLAAGGKVVALSGNTLYWRMTFDPSLTIIECRKTAVGEDARWLPPWRWGERWHSDDGQAGGVYPLLGRPAHQVLGLDHNGMIDDGTPDELRGRCDVVAPDHRLFHHPEVVPITERRHDRRAEPQRPEGQRLRVRRHARRRRLARRAPAGDDGARERPRPAEHRVAGPDRPTGVPTSSCGTARMAGACSTWAASGSRERSSPTPACACCSATSWPSSACRDSTADRDATDEPKGGTTMSHADTLAQLRTAIAASPVVDTHDHLRPTRTSSGRAPRRRRRPVPQQLPDAEHPGRGRQRQRARSDHRSRRSSRTPGRPCATSSSASA